MILFVTPRYGRGSGGLGVSAARIVEGLATHDRVHVVELADDLPTGTYESLADRTRVSSVGERRLVQQLVSDRVLALATPDAQLFGFYAADLAYTVMLTARLLECDYVLFTRGNDIDLEPFGEAGPRIFTALEHARLVFCVSREIEHKVKRWVPSARTRYVPNGVDPSVFGWLPPTKRDVLRVGIFGDLKQKKGLELLLAHLDYDRFALRIVGTLRSEGEKLLHGFATLYPQRAARIEHVPFVESAGEIARIYADVDIVCLPSTHEGMSNVMLEAMSSGRVCVASRVGGALDVIEEGRDGFLFTSGDAEDLGTALDRAAKAALDPEQRVLRAARAKIEARFSAAAEARAYRDALTS